MEEGSAAPAAADDDETPVYNEFACLLDDRKNSHYTPPMVERPVPGRPDRVHIIENRVYELPQTTSLLCWWDCHPFDGPSHAYPIDEQGKEGVGFFCQPACIAAYLRSGLVGNGARQQRLLTLFTLMCQRLYGLRGRAACIRPAPPREMLRAFGGPWTIEEFRQRSNRNHRVELLQPPLSVRIQKVHEQIHSERQRQLQQSLAFHAGQSRANANDAMVAGSAGSAAGPLHSSSSRKKRHENAGGGGRRHDTKEPVKHEPLKLMRGTQLPGSTATLTSFMDIKKKKP